MATLEQQYEQHKQELLMNQAQQFELSTRYRELTVIVKALELGVQREKELLSSQPEATKPE